MVKNNYFFIIIQAILTQGSAAWLSLSIQNAPILAIAASPSHMAWCDHSKAVVTIFIPIRNNLNNDVIYKDHKTLPVKSCIQTLCTNPFNKDMFAGGTYSGSVLLLSIKE